MATVGRGANSRVGKLVLVNNSPRKEKPMKINTNVKAGVATKTQN
jgi:hypothetical protein